MTFFQRLSGFVFTVSAFFTLFSIVAMLTMPVVLISGGTLVAYSTPADLRWQIRYCFIAIMTARLNEYVTFLPAGYRINQRGGDSMLWMAPYHAMTIIRSFVLPKWLGGRQVAFSASGSIKSELNERNARFRAPLWRRLKVILWDCNAYLHILYVLFIIAAVTLSTYRAFDPEKNVRDTLFYLLTHAFWPPVVWLICASSCLQPLIYAIWPPTMPDREEMMDRDPKTGIAHPKEEWKQQRWGVKNSWYEIQYTTLTVYTSFIFALSFFY